MELALRAASVDDCLTLYDISCQAHLDDAYRAMIPPEQYQRFRQVYTPSDQRQQWFIKKMTAALQDPHARVWVAEADEVVGYTVAGLQHEVWVLQGLFVLPRYQGQGVGRSLFQASCEAAPPGVPIELKVIASNQRAIRLYEAEGFERVATAREQFFGAPQDRMRYKQPPAIDFLPVSW